MIQNAVLQSRLVITIMFLTLRSLFAMAEETTESSVSIILEVCRSDTHTSSHTSSINGGGKITNRSKAIIASEMATVAAVAVEFIGEGATVALLAVAVYVAI